MGGYDYLFRTSVPKNLSDGSGQSGTKGRVILGLKTWMHSHDPYKDATLLSVKYVTAWLPAGEDF